MSAVSIPDALAINIASQCDGGRACEENLGTVCHTQARLGDLLVVAEGIGACGKRISRMALDTISSSVEGMPAFFPPAIAVEEALCHANAAIAAAAAEPDCRGSQMGATVIAALLHSEDDEAHAPVQAVIGHVGNSRAYLVHNQELTLLTSSLTVDQNLSEYQTASQEAETHSDKSPLTPYLGMELNVHIQMREVPLHVGDTLLLCSDGLWSCVPEQQILRILADRTRSVEEASRALLNLALDAGGHDNVAFEVARLDGESNAAAPACAIEPRAGDMPRSERDGEFTPASDTSQRDLPHVPAVLEKVGSVRDLPTPKRNNVLSLIGHLGRRLSDKNAEAERPTPVELAPASVSGVQPIVCWAAPERIIYGTGLSSAQLNATASVQGRFLYTPGPGYILPAGTHTLWAAFSAADSPEDNPVLAEVSITVSKATPSIQWATPADVLTGAALSAAQLNASASIPGTFDYSPGAGEVLSAGRHALAVTFNPKDNANYTTAQAIVSVNVAKTVPEINWARPESIPYGMPIGAAELSASASVPGTFEYSPAPGEVLSAGSHTLSVTFIPDDRARYSTALANVPLTVTKATPAITWPAPKEIVYGSALNDTQLNATASVPGAFYYNPAQGAMLAAGEHAPSVTFTPSNLSDYAPAQAAITLTVAKAAPAVIWHAPDSISSDTPLSSAQLNASASIPGTFIYNPAPGELLEPGIHTLSVTFTPDDQVNYVPAHVGVSLVVSEIISPDITWPGPISISYGTALGHEQLNARSTVPGSFFYTPAAGHVLPPGEHKLSVTFTPDDRERYAMMKTVVTIKVGDVPNATYLLKTAPQSPSASGAVVGFAAAGSANARSDDQPVIKVQRETRLYKGATYEKGDDGQWHLQQK